MGPALATTPEEKKSGAEVRPRIAALELQTLGPVVPPPSRSADRRMPAELAGT